MSDEGLVLFLMNETHWLCFSYLYGEPVQGTAYVVFGVKINQDMIRLSSVKQVSDVSRSI